MSFLRLISASPWFIYLKLAALAALVAGAGYTAWSIRGAYADREKTEAVDKAVAAIQKDLDAERKLRGEYETFTNDKVEALMKSISKLQNDFKGVAGNIAKERASNPQFYEQPIPDGGYAQWQKAKELLKSTVEPEPQP